MHIELDESEKVAHPRRGWAQGRGLILDSLKTESFLRDSDMGRDEIHRLCGLFILLGAIPELVSVLRYPSLGGFIALGIPAYFGIEIMRGDSFALKFVFGVCLAGATIGPLYVFISGTSLLSVAGSFLQNVCLLVLVTRDRMHKNGVYALLAFVLIGFLMNMVGVFLAQR